MPELVDINTADVEALDALPGVGEAIAGAIVAYREQHGRFDSVSDLREVEGVTDRLLKQIAGLVTVGEPPGRPAPGESLTVTLVSAEGDGDFTGHTVSVTGVRHTGDAATGDVPFTTSAASDGEGVSQLSIPARAMLVDDITIGVRGPDGHLLVTQQVNGGKLPMTVRITVDPAPAPTTQPNEDPDAGRPTRLRGQVIDSAGRRPAAALQVVLWAAETQNPQVVDFEALTVSVTDGQGFFGAPYPLGTFTAAHATVGLPDGPVTVPVHLEDGGVFPETVILVIDLPTEVDDDDDCGCGSDTAPRSPDATDLARADGTFSADAGAGRCVDFTKPDRTLEEHTFTYLVRTTEPEIKGLTLDPPPKVPTGHLHEILTSVTPVRDAVVTARMAVARGSASAAERADTDVAEATDAAPLPALIDASALKSLTRSRPGVATDAIYAAAELTRHSDLQRYLNTALASGLGRTRLTGANPVDWDDDPTVYQATTVAHGHVLRFKQEWVADGYSMGNLLYSLPLAPGQKKQVAVVDWERRETTAREESTEARDSMQAALDRDRDISEIVSGTLSESTRGGSSASSSSFAGGFGIGAIVGPVGGLLGVGGGSSSANSSAWQDSSRSTAANALNQLRDRTIQSASSVRSQRTSVINTVSQGERVSVTTESVANYNHCHALTIQYFEVLRHLLVRQRLVDVQECLLVPLLMSWFTDEKALRWRSTLARFVPASLRGGFDALDRIDASYAGSDLPVGRYADDNLETVEGELNLRFQLSRPRDKDDDFDPASWNPLLGLFGFTPQDFYNQYLKDAQFKDRVFLEQLGPRIAGTLVGALRVNAVKSDDSTVDLRIDPTLVTRFANDQSLFVSLRMSGALPAVHRADIKAIVVSAQLALPGLPFTINVLPAGSRVIVDSGALRYSTAHMSGTLFANGFIRNDLTGFDDVRIETPLNKAELRNPREEDKELARNLLDHLNENLEVLHHRLWGAMSDARRFMLLDGFEAPNSGGRSVASVVENELIGIVGNSLVMPVARGFHLDPTFKQDVENPIDLLEHYQPNTPIEPSRIAVPTSGVYAEAVMGACNSCEVMDETRFWRWEESPIPDSPPEILPTSTDTRRATPADVTPTPFAQPIIAMQSAPAAPDPTGLGAAFGLLGQSGVFRDMAGLEGTQRNAAAALEQAFSTATTFGTKAADLALQGKMSKDIDKAMKTIQSAKSQGLIDDKKAAELTEKAISAMVGGGTTNPTQATTTDEVKQLTDKAGENAAAVSVTRPTGEKIDIDAKTPGEDSGVKPLIILSTDTEKAETRAFGPSTSDRTGVITVSGMFRNAASGAHLRWSSPGGADILKIDNPNDLTTRVRGMKPGRRDLDVDLLDGGATGLASIKLKLSIPQWVKVVEDQVAFDQSLTDAHIPTRKDDVIAFAKEVVDALLATVNARVYWQVGSLNQALPGHVPAADVVVATIHDKSGGHALYGRTNPPGGTQVFNETIDVFPGAYNDPADNDLDTEAQALVLQLSTDLVADPALEDIQTLAFGRLLGETIAHEIVHALLWKTVSPNFHNNPSIPGELMNAGAERSFKDRTGLENTRQQSPVHAGDYVDHGVATINVLQAANQALIDANFPVPPALP